MIKRNSITRANFVIGYFTSGCFTSATTLLDLNNWYFDIIIIIIVYSYEAHKISRAIWRARWSDVFVIRSFTVKREIFACDLFCGFCGWFKTAKLNRTQKLNFVYSK